MRGTRSKSGDLTRWWVGCGRAAAPTARTRGWGLRAARYSGPGQFVGGGRSGRTPPRRRDTRGSARGVAGRGVREGRRHQDAPATPRGPRPHTTHYTRTFTHSLSRRHTHTHTHTFTSTRRSPALRCARVGSGVLAALRGGGALKAHQKRCHTAAARRW